MGTVRCRPQTFVCGLDAAIDVVGGKWKVLIIWALQEGPRRFGALRRSLDGVSEKMLIQHLRELERDQVVHREVHQAVPPRVEYSLTGYGTALVEALRPLGAWGCEHKERLESLRAEPPVDQRSGHGPSATTPHPRPAGLRGG